MQKRYHISNLIVFLLRPKWYTISITMDIYFDTARCRYNAVDFLRNSHSVHPIAHFQWRHNEHDGVSNHQLRDYLLNFLTGRKSKKTSKLRVTGFCMGNSPVIGEFPAQKASNAENVSIWWRHHICFASVTAVMYGLSCYILPWYKGTRLYFVIYLYSSITMWHCNNDFESFSDKSR